ncbi:MAG: efflux RND transporter periplasmic adaptor subunit [Alphaproteobacteria bacterium]|nr:efflux RND transporter periplasmic adaptor subunit [Alphaproteobacteria bacterium]
MQPPSEKSSKIRGFGKKMAAASLTLIVVAGAVGAAGFGAQWLKKRADAASPALVVRAKPVSVTPIRIEPGFEVQRQFLGQLEAAQASDLSFEFGGRIADLTVDEGAIVKKGDILAALDTSLLETNTSRQRAARKALQAQFEFSKKSVERREALSQRGFTSQEALDEVVSRTAELAARIAEISAAIENAEIMIRKSKLVAPFDGRIAARYADSGATIGAGERIFELLETGRPKVRVGLPVSLDIAEGAELEVEIADARYVGQVRAVRPDVDPRTRTRSAILTLQDGPQEAYGQLALVRTLSRVETPGAWTPISALREGAQGLWTILIVDSEGQVRPAAVEVIHAEAERVFVRGSFQDGDPMIDLGQHRVTPGQSVRVVEAM